MNPNEAQQPQAQPLDPSVVALAKSIGQSESGGQYQAKGKSGEFGAYQFTQPTWQAWAGKHLGDSNAPMTPENQDKVAYSQIAEWGKQGYKPSQIASLWNSGKPDPTGNVGTNKYGVHFDTPSYVQKVGQYYNKMMMGQQVQGPDPTNPSATNAQPQGQPQQEDKGFLSKLFSGDIVGAGKDAVNWAFPILKDVADDIHGTNQKSVLQHLGDLGLSALWFVPGLGEAGLGAKILEGAGIGYGAGALSSLSEGKGLAESITPNTSNILGAATGGAAGGLLSGASKFIGKNFTQKGAVEAIEGNLESAIRATKSGTRFAEDASRSGFKPSKILANANAIPDIVDGKFVTAPAEEVINKRISQLGEVRAQALDKIGTTVPLEGLRTEALSQVKGLAATGETQKIESQINKIFDDFKLNFGEDLAPSQLEQIKEAQAAASGIYKRTGQIGEQNGSSIIGDVSRRKIETLAEDAGFPGMKEYNKYIQAHYQALKALDKLNGQVVKGGRLGSMLRGHTIAGISAMGANAAGGGFLGTLAAAGLGEGANNVISKILGDTSFTNYFRDSVLKKIETENPEIVQRLLDFSGQSGKVASELAPKTSKTGQVAGLLPNLLMKTAGRGGAGVTAR